MLTFGSLFAGIGGFDLGFHQAGLTCAWQVEIDSAARSVLARHWPDVERYEDVRSVGASSLAPVDIICGGFPCQDLSVAGKRSGLAGARSGLFYEMTRIVDELRPMFLVWENVPGLLSSDGGRDFGRVLMELDRIGYSGCWTTLDAQFFGVAQRRQRIFGVFACGDIGAAVCAEILSLAARLPWNTEKGGKTRAGVAGTFTAGAHPGSYNGQDADAGLLIPAMVASALSASHGGADDNDAQAGHIVALPSVVPTLGKESYSPTKSSSGQMIDFCIAFTERTREEGRTLEAQEDLAYALTNPGSGGRTHSRQIAGGFGVRRLTPLECERLQGFPDGWTEGQSDSVRYRQLGNAVAVPCARWIGVGLAFAPPSAGRAADKAN